MVRDHQKIQGPIQLRILAGRGFDLVTACKAKRLFRAQARTEQNGITRIFRMQVGVTPEYLCRPGAIGGQGRGRAEG